MYREIIPLTDYPCTTTKLKLFIAWRPAGQLPERAARERAKEPSNNTWISGKDLFS